MFLIILLGFSYIINSSLADVSSIGGELPKVSDLANIFVSLGTYNVSNPDGESIESLHLLQPHSQYEIIVTNIPSNVHFVVMQVHSYLLNVTLSHSKIPLRDNSITGTNVGLLKVNEKSDLSFYLTYNSSDDDLDIMIATQAYGIEAPVPGGCNMEFQVEISPFLQTTYDDTITKVDFAPAAPSVIFLSNSALNPSDECDIKPSPIEHKMYHRYFPERDFTKETYFQMMKSMMTKGRILENGAFVHEKLTGSLVRRIFSSYPGTGNAFVVMCQFMNHTAVYVPSFTYACDDLKEHNTCLVLTTTFSRVLCASILFMGLFACFVGHYFFRTEIFLFGFLVSGIITYILISVFIGNTMALSIAVSSGFFVAGSMLVLWAVFGLPIISVTLATLTVGFLLASIILYSIVDYVDLLVLDINYWGIFIGIVILCPMLMLSLAEKANIAACSFMGSYVAILSVDHYLGSNLRYIALNTIRRATVEEFKLAVIDPPFQVKDCLLVITWGILMFSGIEIQRFLLKNKPPYPPPVNPITQIFKRLRGPSRMSEPTEASPLLRNSISISSSFIGGRRLIE